MNGLICEQLARLAGFNVSAGNWITPDGSIILCNNNNEHHWDTLSRHLNIEKTDNNLGFMNSCVCQGYIRLVFRNDIFFQVGCNDVSCLWSDAENYRQMRKVLANLRHTNIDVHILGVNFRLTGKAADIVDQNITKLEIKNENIQR